MKTSQPASGGMSQADLDRLYDDLAALVDRTPREHRERVLARLAVTLMQELGACDRARRAIELAGIV